MKIKQYICLLLITLPLIVFADNETNKNEIKKKCQYPDQPIIPNALSITEEELITTQQKVKTFIKEGEQYLKCIAKVEKSWGDDVTFEQKQSVALIHNKVVENMEAVADLFNSALRVYKGNK
ncbi:MAG: hypothetical protein HND53_03590 [Proteobacteria bacterium]|nr:hypothetical protein [Pseudomonadota bacterium]NOG59557.1 hypothetical protein [Pseudomonadota bacterium]